MSTSKSYRPWLMLFLRSLLFLGFQAVFALIFLLSGNKEAWNASATWWPFAVIFTNLVCLALLIYFYKQERKKFKEIFRIARYFVKKDLLFLLGFFVLTGILGYLLKFISAKILFGNLQTALDLLVRPLPAWAAILSFLLLPILQGIVEIPIYMFYALPRLEKQGLRPWMAVVLTSFFLSAQYVFAPFLPDVRFITFRLVMFLPYALIIALVMRWRPRLMPYMIVIHALINTSIAVMFLLILK